MYRGLYPALRELFGELAATSMTAGSRPRARHPCCTGRSGSTGYVFDLDGTIYLGKDLLPGAPR